MKITEIRELNDAELAERIETEVANYENMKFGHYISPVENNSQIKKLPRDIARMKTVLRERELNK